MADSTFGFSAILGSHPVGEAAGTLRHNGLVSPVMVSSVASSPGGLSEFFLKGTKSAVAAKSSRLARPTYKTNCTLPTSETIPRFGMEPQLLAPVHNRGAELQGCGPEYPSHTTAPRKAGRELARRNARNSSDHSKSQIVHWSVRLSVPKRRSNELRKDSNTL